MVDQIVPVAPARVLDVATGTAGVAIQLAARTAGSIIGADLTLGMLQQGRRRWRRLRLTERIPLTAGRAEQLPFPDASFDALTFTYLLRYVDDPSATLRELGRVVKPGRDHGQPGLPGPTRAASGGPGGGCTRAASSPSPA